MIFCTKNKKGLIVKKICISKKTLENICLSQAGIGVSYVPGRIEIEDSIVEQSIDILDGYASGEIVIANADVSTLEQIAKHMLHIVKGPLYKKVFSIYQKIKINIKKIQQDEKLYADFSRVVSVLNNKKQAQNMSMENLLQAKETIQKDTQHSSKQKQRLMQQLQSYALRKYGEAKKICNNEFEPYKHFVSSFNLSYQKVNTDLKDNQAQNVVDISKQEKSPSVFAKYKAKAAQKLQQLKHNVKKAYYKYEALIAVGCLALVSFVGWKGVKSACEPGNSDFHYNITQTLSNQTDADKKQEESKTISFAQAQQAYNQNAKGKTTSDTKVEVQKTTLSQDYYDTSLQIHLGSSDAVQKLYNKIDSLAQAGKIKFADGLSTKRYAHSFTMYNLIRPNSAENKAIQNLLAGGSENPDLINRLVLKAKAKGEGIKPDNNSIKTSNFDKAAKSLQLQHLKNLQMQR